MKGMVLSMRLYRVVGILSLLLLLSGFSTRAAEGDEAQAQSSDEAELAALLSIVDEETELATKTKMNSDYVPGIVTVLHGDDLEALGIRNVWEALSLVPGLQPVLDNTASPAVTVRGIPFSFNSGNIKVMVNSIATSQENSGIHTSALYLPIELVDRIEVIRGPGSSIYGDFAFLGLVNVITRQEMRPVFARIQDDDAYEIGGLVSWASPHRPFRFSLALSRWNDEEAGHADTVRGYEERTNAILSLEYGDFSLRAHGLRRNFSAEWAEDEDDSGESTGGSLQPPEPPEPPGPPDPELRETMWAAEIHHKRTWSPSLDTDVHFSFLRNDYWTQGTRFKGDIVEGGIDLSWKGWSRQTWLLGVSYSCSRTDDAEKGRPPDPPNPPEKLELQDLRRKLFSVWIQDQIAATEHLTVTVGLRYDHFSDVEKDRVTPRLALVWHPADRHILKVQYAEGFRAPSFWELYWSGERNPDLQMETVATTELNYVYRRPGLVGRITLFDSRIRDRIHLDQTNDVFDNSTRADSRGVEMEWNQELADWLKMGANVSYVDPKETGSGEYLPDPAASRWMGNLSLLAKPWRNFVAGLRWHHVGDRFYEAPEGNGYDMVDLTLSYYDFLATGLTLRAGVKNLTDREQYFIVPKPKAINTYLYPGRTVWFQVSLKL